MKSILALMAILFPLSLFAALPAGQTPSSVRLSGGEGGKVTGESWSSDEMKGKFFMLYYVDPDEKTLNDEATEQFKAVKKDYDRYGSVAIINMDATWLPNAAIARSLKSKQEEFPRTIYVKDMEKKLVKSWNLGDDNHDITVFDPEGKVLFSKDGKLNQQEIDQIVAWIKEYAGAEK